MLSVFFQSIPDHGINLILPFLHACTADLGDQEIFVAVRDQSRHTVRFTINQAYTSQILSLRGLAVFPGSAYSFRKERIIDYFLTMTQDTYGDMTAQGNKSQGQERTVFPDDLHDISVFCFIQMDKIIPVHPHLSLFDVCTSLITDHCFRIVHVYSF